MKVSIIAGILLGCLIILVIVNAAYIHGVTDWLVTRLKALPETPTAETVAKVMDVAEDFQKVEPILRLTITAQQLDKITELTTKLLVATEEGDVAEYRQTLLLLTEVVTNLKKGETFKETLSRCKVQHLCGDTTRVFSAYTDMGAARLESGSQADQKFSMINLPSYV